MTRSETTGIGVRADHTPLLSTWLTVGVLLWLIRVVIVGVAPLNTHWAVTLLLFSPLVLVPLLWRRLLHERGPVSPHNSLKWIEWLMGPAAWLLIPACVIEQGTTAALLTAPWLCVTMGMALCGVRYGWVHKRRPSELSLAAGPVYIVIGAVWLVMWRLGRWPLAYKEVIAMLTAIHFHFAGLVLPILACWSACAMPGRLSDVACVGVIFGVPSTAVGITATHVGFSPLLEATIVTGFSAISILMAGVQFAAALKRDVPLASRALLMISSISLVSAMTLATLYGFRDLGGPAWLDIPWMRALHGTTNAFGTCLCGILGWSLLPHAPVADLRRSGI